MWSQANIRGSLFSWHSSTIATWSNSNLSQFEPENKLKRKNSSSKNATTHMKQAEAVYRLLQLTPALLFLFLDLFWCQTQEIYKYWDGNAVYTSWHQHYWSTTVLCPGPVNLWTNNSYFSIVGPENMLKNENFRPKVHLKELLTIKNYTVFDKILIKIKIWGYSVQVHALLLHQLCSPLAWPGFERATHTFPTQTSKVLNFGQNWNC